MPVKVEIAPDVGDEDRNFWIVLIDGNVSDTSIMSDDVFYCCHYFHVGCNLLGVILPSHLIGVV